MLSVKAAQPRVQLTWLRRAAIFAGTANNRIPAAVKSRIKCVVYVLVRLLTSVIVRSANLQHRHATNASPLAGLKRIDYE